MKKVRIADKEVFPIGFGTWSMGDKAYMRAKEIEALMAGIEKGIQMIDTAEMYGDGNAERLVAEAITPYDRDKLFIVSKVHPMNASREKLPVSLDNSLKRLKVDYLDQYLLHWQGNIPLEETIQALEKERRKGKIKSWGVSNLDMNELNTVIKMENGRNCASNQVRYNLGDRGIEYDLLPVMRQHDIPLIAYAPVAKGDKLGSNFAKQKVLLEIASNHQCDIFQLLLAWCIRDGKTIAIPQSSNRKHVVNNAAAANIRLTDEEFNQIDSIYGRPVSKQPLALW